MRVTYGLGRFAVRLVLTILAATFLVRLAIELSIRGGFRAVLFPSGPNPRSPQDQAIIEQFHLDNNIVVRHVRWVGDVLGGDLGQSIERRGMAVSDLVLPRLSISFELMMAGVIGSLVLGIGLGVLTAHWSQRPVGRVADALVAFLQGLPVYVTPVFLLWVFALELKWLPGAGWVRISKSLTGNLESLVLPALTLILAETGAIARVIRGDMLRVLERDYITAAYGKGLTNAQVLFRHALRPSSLGVLNVIAVNIGGLLAGSIIVEVIFGIGGLGQLVLRSSTNRDLQLLLALTTYMVAIYTTLNAIVDGLIVVLDPRIERRGQRWRT